ncbi:winged helix-turn-helix domain-containing protein [Pseudactinotalea sp. HY160]|uniref:winged helix-turn-helix domain-containing protein n=1 Tax=Pseudactinotalea sp. HY160 TaxID=2654490 RepID=UPI001D14E53D|nr:winged helix-turn-helix domain-containing protein [Pseudactinotalea sp. HY160]
MFVITADQHASQRSPDRVPAILEALAAAPGLRTVRAFERTVGDEIQGVLGDAADVIRAAARLNRHGHWAVGIGAGPVEELARTSAASRGPVFVAARRAVERARSKAVPVPVAVDWSRPSRGAEVDHAEALMRLVASIERRRSDAGWEVIDLLPGTTQAAVSDRLGISPAAVSQRLRAARWAEVQAVEPLLRELLIALHRAADPRSSGDEPLEED